MAFISALFFLPHITFNEWPFLAKGFIWPIICCASSSINISPDELGAKERGITRCLSFSLPYYHIVSLVSHSNRSGLRSLVETGIRARVSLCAQNFFALYPSQASLPPFPSFLVPSSSAACQAQVSFTLPFLCSALSRPHLPHSLCPVPTIVFMHCAVLSGTLHCWGFTLFYSLICLARPSEEGNPCVFSTFPFFWGLFPFFPLFHHLPLSLMSLFPSNSQIFTTFKHHYAFVHIAICRDSLWLLCLAVIYLESCVVIYKLYIWRIASPQLCKPDLSHWPPSLFLFSITAREQYFIPGELLVNVHTYHCLSLLFH